MRLIDEQYVEEVDFDLLMEGAISGMLNKLDPHSAYINKTDFQKTTEEFDGEFEGIGIEFSIQTTDKEEEYPSTLKEERIAEFLAQQKSEFLSETQKNTDL